MSKKASVGGKKHQGARKSSTNGSKTSTKSSSSKKIKSKSGKSYKKLNNCIKMPSSVGSSTTSNVSQSDAEKSSSRKGKKKQIEQPVPMMTSKSGKAVKASVGVKGCKEGPAADLVLQSVVSSKCLENDVPSSTGAKLVSSKLCAANSENSSSTPNFSAVSAAVVASSPRPKTVPKTAIVVVKSSGGKESASTPAASLGLANDGSVFCSSVKNGQYLCSRYLNISLILSFLVSQTTRHWRW